MKILLLPSFILEYIKKLIENRFQKLYSVLYLYLAILIVFITLCVIRKVLTLICSQGERLE